MPADSKPSGFGEIFAQQAFELASQYDAAQPADAKSKHSAEAADAKEPQPLGGALKPVYLLLCPFKPIERPDGEQLSELDTLFGQQHAATMKQFRNRERRVNLREYTPTVNGSTGTFLAEVPRAFDSLLLFAKKHGLRGPQLEYELTAFYNVLGQLLESKFGSTAKKGQIKVVPVEFTAAFELTVSSQQDCVLKGAGI